MEHPHYDSGIVFPTDHRLAVDRSRWDVHERAGFAVQRKHQLPRGVMESERLLATAFYLRPRAPAEVVSFDIEGKVDLGRTESLNRWIRALRRQRLPARPFATGYQAIRAFPQAIRQADAQARAHRAIRKGRPTTARPAIMTLRAMSEQVPDRLSRVSLAEERDRFGVPIARLDWRLTELDFRSMARSQELAGPRLAAVLGAPVHSLFSGTKIRAWGGSHQMGTTRMAASPRHGVVDSDCRVHGMSNLYVSGPSVFPSVGMANPTLSIVALGLRLGAHLSHRG
jgi:choline dehydrogenase-like flavoprotein